MRKTMSVHHIPDGDVNGSTETTALTTGQERSTVTPVLVFLDNLSCIVVMLPTALMNGLAAVSGDAEKLGQLKTPGDFWKFLENAAAGRIIYGVAAMSVSGVVFFYLNKKYLAPSMKATIDIFRRVAKTIFHKCKRQNILEEDSVSYADILIFSATLFSSLVFGMIGAKTVSFLELPGEIIGYGLNYVVYFGSRFAVAKFTWDEWKSAENRKKHFYLTQMQYIDWEGNNVLTINNLGASDVEVIRKLITMIDNDWDTLPKEMQRLVLLKYLAPLLGGLAVAASLLPLYSGLTPSSVEGLNELFRTHVGQAAGFQDGASLTLGVFLNALTLLFYELNIYELPKHFLETAILAYERFKEGDIKSVARIITKTGLAFGASWLASIGFRLVGESALLSGYLGYLGSVLEHVIPDAMFAAVLTMLWSHLQHLINQAEEGYGSTRPNYAELTKLFQNPKNFSEALSDEETDYTDDDLESAVPQNN